MVYTKQIARDYYDVIIIGSGMAGLSCAANLVARGLSVLVLEQHYIPGGATTMFKRGNFYFEGGGHRVTGIKTPGAPLYELLTIVEPERRIKTVPINPSYVVKIKGKTLYADLDIQKYKQNLIELFPAQANSIKKFIADMQTINQALKYVVAGRVNPLRLFTQYRLFIKYSKSTVAQVMNEYFTDNELITFVTAVGNYTTLPISQQSFINFANMWSAHHLGEGMSLIEGGTRILVEAIVNYIEEHGGQVVVSKDVSKIIIENQKAVGVETRDGAIINAGFIVSTASNEETYLKLIDPSYLKPSFIKQIQQQVQSGALFQLFLGIKELDKSGLENVTTFVLGSEEYAEHLKKINNWDIEAITAGAVLTVEGSEHSPAGMRSINISCLCPYDHPENWYINGSDKKKYNEFKEQLADRLIETMASHIPYLKNRIVLKNTATPLTMYHYTRATRGGLQGLAHTLSQSGKNRGSLKSPVANLYRAGQYVFPGAGIVTVTTSGKLCADLITSEFNRSAF
ncbi:MAG: NAD(P)/FAD-dependent oxidoreductase [Syntrophomonas sp.]